MKNFKFAALALGILLQGVALAQDDVVLSQKPLNDFSQLKSGDILFIRSNSGARADSIEEITEAPLTHCGILIKQGGSTIVYEGAGHAGTYKDVKTWQRDESTRKGEPPPVPLHSIYVRRYTGSLEGKLDALGKRAKELHDTPYDNAFAWNNREPGSGKEYIYCSELIWKAFHDAVGVDLGGPHPLKDYLAGGPTKKAKAEAAFKKYLGEHYNSEEKVISPTDVFKSDKLVGVTDEAPSAAFPSGGAEHKLSEAVKNQGPVRFAAIGDFGTAREPGNAADQASNFRNEKAVADLVKSWKPDFIITLGDDNYPLGRQDTIDDNIGQLYSEFIGNYHGKYKPAGVESRFFPALGNHDWGDGHKPITCKPYTDYFELPGNERYYDFVQGPVHFYVLDSDDSEPDGVSAKSKQAVWLHKGLADAKEPWKLVYFHHAPFSSGSQHGSAKWMQWPFKEWGATAVLAGHEHNYEHVVRDGFHYFVNGLGGDPIYDDFSKKNSKKQGVDGSVFRYAAKHGAMLIEATDEEIAFHFFTTSGEEPEQVTKIAAKPAALPSASFTLSDAVKHAGESDGSAGIAVGEDHFIGASDENNVLRLYSSDSADSGKELLDLNLLLRFEKEEGEFKECDLEGAARLGDLIFWIGSHGRNKNGKVKESRRVLFATASNGSGADVRLTLKGKPCKSLMDSFMAIPELKSAAAIKPEDKGGLNIESLCARGDSLLIGFRNPVSDQGALVVPLLNPLKVIDGKPPVLGESFRLNLQGRGIRDMTRWQGQFLIVAGDYQDRTAPAPKKPQLFKWSGNPQEPPAPMEGELGDLNPEAALAYGQEGKEKLQLLSDDGGEFFRSVWVKTSGAH